MAVTTVQESSFQQQELFFSPIKQHSEFDDIKSFLDQIRSYQIPKTLIMKQKVISVDELRSDKNNFFRPRISIK